MSNHFQKISDHLYQFPDTCNVYVIKEGRHGLLIDGGSGEVSKHLEEIGVEEIEWVLHTHHHRDQCWGDGKLTAQGGKIAVPQYEKYLFEDVEKFWQHKRIFDNYNDRSTFFSLSENVKVQRTLADYETFDWRDYKIKIMPAKGHTAGSVNLIMEIDGRKVAFTGDLIYKGGKLYQLHSMEYTYGDMKGLLFTHQSISHLQRENPDLCLPSHGPSIDEPNSEMKKLKARIRRLVRLTNPEKEEALDERLYPISKHLLWGGASTCSNFYVLLSESGKALFVDYGHSFPEHMHTDADREDDEVMRFVAHRLDELFGTYAVEEIDAVIPTHVHDDHTCGIPYLQEHHGAECWTIEQMAPILEEPARWSSTPCCFHEPIRIQRKFSSGDEFSWQEYSFNIYHAPGQTEFHSILTVEIDDREVAFTGDNVFKDAVATWGTHSEDIPVQTQVFRNSFQPHMHRQCRDLLQKIVPDRICPGHGEVFDFDELNSSSYADYVNRKEGLFEELSPEPMAQHVDLFWARLLPYQSFVKAGERRNFTLLLRNNFKESKEFEGRLRLPEGWQSIQGEGAVKLAPGERGTLSLSGEVLDGLSSDKERELVTVEVLIDGESRGPVAEALVEYEPTDGSS